MADPFSKAAGVTIRAARPAEAAEMQRIEIEAGRQFLGVGLDAVAFDEPPGDAEMAEHIDTGTAWVAVVDGTLVGYAIASVVDGQGHLDQVSVLPGWGRQGVGRALLGAVVAWSRGRGHDALTLTTFRNVPWNAPYYARLGFVSLPAGALGPQLAAIRAGEMRLDSLQPRVAMGLPLRD